MFSLIVTPLRLRLVLLLILLRGLFLADALHAQLDTVVFGNPGSEAAHSIAVNASSTATGALSQSCRYLMPIPAGTTYGVNGGDITVTMAVDPNRRNHFTLKLWGGDDDGEDLGRLYLYVPIDGVNHQVGYRHEGDYLPLSVSGWAPPLPGRFFYSTTLLPLWMTKGRTSLSFKIVATGELYGLGSGGPPSGTYQKVMRRNSRNIYRAYTHVDACATWAAGEMQGAAPATTTRPASGSAGAGTMSPGGGFFTGVNGRINTLLNTAVSSSTVYTAFTPHDVAYLGRSYSVSGLVGYQNSAVVNKVVSLMDAFAADYYATPAHAQDWGGNYGELGFGIHYLDAAGALGAAVFDTVVDYGGTAGSKTRRAAWGDMFFASREYGRISSRRALTNQAMIASEHIYCANRGLLVLGDSRAFSETIAQRYLRDACGLAPWQGNDAASNMSGLPSDGTARPYGGNYHQVTSKGLTREWGYVGAGYGEMAYHVIRWYRMNRNTEFRDQAVKMAKARGPFRRPAMEVNGSANYRTMEVTGLLSWRGVHECDGNFDGYIGYADAADVNERGKGMTVAAATGDPTLIGYAKQMLADNNYFSFLTDYTDIECLEAFADFQTVHNAADSGARLPMTDGQPDFVWSDEENRIVALKQGNTRLWITPYWHAQGGTGLNGGTGINGVARFHHSTPAYDQYGTMETTPRFRSSGTFTRPNHIDNPGGNHYIPPDNPTNAYAGEVLPLGMKPADATDSQPFGGKADFYAFRFGRYLIGLNAHETNHYALKAPIGFTSGTDLVTGATVSGSAVTVPPASTAVIDIGTTSDAFPVPNAPLLLTAVGSSAPSVTLGWTDSSGASTYTVLRSATEGGPYTEILDADGSTSLSSGLIGTTFTDTTVTAGSAYYYVVTATNANGTSYESMEAAASAGIPLPWMDADVGSVGSAGNASYLNQTFTISGAGSNVGGTSDTCNFVHLPVAGDGVMIARIASRVLSGSGADKIGLMIREDLTPGSRYFALMLDRATISGAADRLRMSHRSSSGGSAVYPADSGSSSLPCWLKVQRVGNVFRSHVSPDGNTWTRLGGDIAISMNSTANFGMFACSRNPATAVRATFDGVTIQPDHWGSAPDAPTGLRAVPGAGGASLTWIASAGATHYQVKRGSGSGGPYSLIGSSGSPLFADSGLANGSTYYYVVSAVNAVGEGGDSDEVSATPVLVPPQPPTGLTAQAGNRAVSLSWNASFDATGYHVKRSEGAGGPFTTLSGSPVSGTGFTDTTATNGTTYHYIVTALGAGGESEATAEVSATPAAVPSVPTGLSAVGGNGQVSLSWAPSLGAISYIIRSSTSGGGAYTVIATGVNPTSYLHTGLANGSTYHYSVSAVNAGGESAASAAVATVPSASVLAVPWAGQNVGAVGVAGGASYANSTFTVLGSGSANVGASADQFYIVSQPGAGDCEIIARVTSLANTDALAKAGLMIRKTLDSNSPYAFVAVTPSSTNGVRLEYRATTGGTSAVAASSTGSSRIPPEWLRLVFGGNTVTAFRSDSTSQPTSWTAFGSINLSGFVGGYHVGMAVTSNSNSATTTATFSKVALTLGTPAAPANPTVTAGPGQARLAWTASPGATSYAIKRGTAGGGPYTTVASGVTATSWTDTKLPGGTIHHYVISASNATGESANSQEVAAVTPAVPTGLVAIAGSGEISLGWEAFPGATDYIVKRATTRDGPYSTIASGIEGLSYQDASAPRGQSCFYVISAVHDYSWQTFDSAESHATRGMPVPWLTQDVGAVAIAGMGDYSQGVISLAATGSDIGGASDTFRIACIPLTGDGSITARLATHSAPATGAKVGLMMRQDLTPGSPTVFARVIGNSMKVAWRGAANANTSLGLDHVTGIPQWYRLTRSGSAFTVSFSADGITWTSANYASATPDMPPNVSMPNTIYVGLAACSRNATNVLNATFDNISVTGWTTPRPPLAPTGLRATGGNNRIGLSWTNVGDATGYNVRRSLASGGPYSPIALNHQEASYTDTDCVNGTTYHYVVSSLGAAGESADAPEVTATAMSLRQAWSFTNFGSIAETGIAANSADPDHDGRANLLEYATGTNPQQPDSGHPLTLGKSSDGLQVTITFKRVNDPALTYRAESSHDLSANGWTEFWSSSGADNVEGVVTLGEPESLSSRPRRFIRLRISNEASPNSP